MSGESLKKHYEWQGKIEVISRMRLDSREALTMAYTPGVAEACNAIAENPDLSFSLTRRWNLVAVVTDGTAVLGLGDIGPRAGMPVMEGKCALFKEFGGVDAFPICIDSKDVDKIVETVRLISYSFGGINLEDIAAPRCFEIEQRLKEVCDIPIFHDDQHGTAVIVAAAMLNACKLTGRNMKDARCVINGAGAAGNAIARLLLSMGIKDIVVCDRKGIISNTSSDPAKRELACATNPRGVTGLLADAMKGADAFIGVSAPNCVTTEMVATMAKRSMVFAMSNPVPEILPDEAKAGGAEVIGTGRSDFPNQINNVLAFPGIFKGALSVRASDISEGMKLAAAQAIADFVTEDKLTADYIIPSAFEPGVGQAVAAAVAAAAKAEGLARI